MKKYDSFTIMKIRERAVSDYGFWFRQLKDIRKDFATDEISREKYILEATTTISKLQTIMQFLDILGYSTRILEKCLYRF